MNINISAIVTATVAAVAAQLIVEYVIKPRLSMPAA